MLNFRELRGLSEEDRLTLATIQNERTRRLASAYLQAESDGERLAILASLAKEAARIREEHPVKLETFDNLALAALLRGDKQEIERLSKLAEAQLSGGACPECDNPGPHMDNGARRVSERSFCCEKCGTHWDAEG